MAQNTNFKGNKNNNQKKKLPYIKVRIDKLVDVDDCNTKAFASVTVSGAVAIHGIRVMNSKKAYLLQCLQVTMLTKTAKRSSARLFTRFQRSQEIC